ncbi:carbamoyl-phosphate synthase large subunit [Elusimicrobiota bacterium]
MPRRTDINKVLVIGSGPIIIGQAAEFDYSGAQACKALREEGCRVVLVNSNPATIMTDSDMADSIYIEPLNMKVLLEIIAWERPDALLATMGGQTGLNVACALHKEGALEKHKIQVLGTSISSIEESEDREKFRNRMHELKEPIPESKTVENTQSAEVFAHKYGFPLIIRPAYTLGGTGGGIAFNDEELFDLTQQGLRLSLIGQVLIEQAILGTQGWGEFEIEVVRDSADNCIVICPMENLDPMGIHTGESIVVAPTQTLNNNDFQTLRSAAIRIIRALKIIGACNVQFAMSYDTGEYRVVEVNPRVSRSSALASKATGYPIARIATKISLGMTLDEIKNDVTKETLACFEPTIDYVVVKIPRWPFDKFETADKRIGTQMKSTGETMAIGRTFEEALQKAIRSLEVGRSGLGHDAKDKIIKDKPEIIRNLKVPTHKRLLYIRDAMAIGMSIREISRLTGVHEWFLFKIKQIYEYGKKIKFNESSISTAKQMGFSDIQIANITGKTEDRIRDFRKQKGITPTFKLVDTCAAEFKAHTPYFYSTYEREDESLPSEKKKVLIVGSGPIRIGQGIEFDYCCVHAVSALREEGVEALIANNNPETVSTDFDISDKLYFEPLTYEDVANIVDTEKPYGVILQFGGQTSINMAVRLHKAGIRILGTPPENTDITEDRKKFGALLREINIPSPAWGTAMSFKEASDVADKIGYPVLVRPSYVLGGRAMKVVDDARELAGYMKEAVSVSPEHPVLIDKFIDNAIEVDVDALSDGEDVFVAAIMEHIEEAGVHSGDSTCVIPPQTINREVKNRIISCTKKLARALRVSGLMNVQYAIKGDNILVLEVNPRASRTVPYVSKTIGVPLAKIATKIMLGKKLKNLGLAEYFEPDFVTVKAPVFPFLKLLGVDPVLSPEMKSTGEVMGIDSDFGKAFYKAQASAFKEIPKTGNVFFSIGRGEQKEAFAPIAKEFVDLGFEVYSTEGTQKFFLGKGIRVSHVPKFKDDPKLINMMKNKDIHLVLNIPRGGRIGSDGYKIRRACVDLSVPYITTQAGALAALKAVKSLVQERILVRSLGDWTSRNKKIHALSSPQSLPRQWGEEGREEKTQAKA